MPPWLTPSLPQGAPELLRLPEDLRRLSHIAGLNQADLDRRAEALETALQVVRTECYHAETSQEGKATLEAFLRGVEGPLAGLRRARAKIPAVSRALQTLLGDETMSMEAGCEAIAGVLDEIVAARISTGSPAEPSSPYMSDAGMEAPPL
jgi:hypothetical protein